MRWARDATICAVLSCLRERAKRESDRQLAELLLKCLVKLTKALTSTVQTIALAPLLMRLHEETRWERKVPASCGELAARPDL